MSASVTFWTSSSTKQAESLVAKIIKATDDLSPYQSLSIANCDINEIRKKINEAFGELVNMTMSDSSLHILAVIPLYEENSIGSISKLTEAISKTDHNVTLHILGLSSHLAHLFDHEGEEKDKKRIMTDAISTLKTSSVDLHHPFSFSIIDDYAANGAPIGFTLNSLSRYIALFKTALIYDYYTVLDPKLVEEAQGKNISIGISSLIFDRKDVINQLLGLGFLAALNNAGINDKAVDLQNAAQHAENILAGLSARYPNIYKNRILPLFKDIKLEEGEVAAKATSIIDEELNLLKDDILGLLSSPNLSMPEKECILAMVLGRDNENLSGMQYFHEGALLDDACNEPLDLYIDAYNRCNPEGRLLPVRGDFKALKVPEWEDLPVPDTTVSVNTSAINPLKEIKRQKQEILNITSFIRDKEEELDSLQFTIEQRKSAEEIRKIWRKPAGELKNVEYKEQPLDEKYTPKIGLKIQDTVDLRTFFNPVRNQMNLGSCTSFAVAAMYEAMMNRNEVKGDTLMSPGYLYYYSNIIQGRPSGGSNFHEQLQIIRNKGICLDRLYSYNHESPEQEPSEDADENATHHRVINAKQIILSTSGNKTDSMLANHEIITSALSEGYPVGISLKIYDNLGKTGPFIEHPEDTPEAKEDGWHAMVVVGYSQENQFYIVRNSWGPEFGEEGYCYIPMSYLDDPEYLNFACIVTEISDTTETISDIPTVLANFGATETDLRIAAIRNAISYQRVALKDKKDLYSDYYSYYQRLLIQLNIPAVQNKLREAAEIAQAKHFIDVEGKKRKLENSFVGSLKEYKKKLRNLIIILFCIAIAFGIIWFVASGNWAWITALASLGLGILVWSGYKWWIRIKRRELQEELDNLAVYAKQQKEKFLSTQIKFHVAGMWLRSFHNLSMELGTVYDRLVSYNDTLRGWKKDYSASVGKRCNPEGQMFRYLDATPILEDYFRSTRKRVVESIDLIKLFQDYQVNLQDLDSSHEDLRTTVKNVINEQMGHFNISHFLLGGSYPFLKPITLQEEMDTLIAVGQPSFRNRSSYVSDPIKLLAVKVETEDLTLWKNKIHPFFNPQPIPFTISDPNTLIIITLDIVEV